MKEIKDKKIYKVRMDYGPDSDFYFREPDKTRNLVDLLKCYKNCILVGEECAREFVDYVIRETETYIQDQGLGKVVGLCSLDDVIHPKEKDCLILSEDGVNVLNITLKRIISFEA